MRLFINTSVIKNNLEKLAKYGGVAAVSFEWLALLTYYLQYPQYFGREYPISYFATLPGTRWVFSGCYFIAAICFWAFAQFHLRKYLGKPVKTFAFSMFCLAAAALLPYNPANSTSGFLHISFSASAFVTFIVGIFLIGKDGAQLFHKISAAAAGLSGSLLVLLLLVPKDNHFIFGLETGSWFVCQVWILWISYTVDYIFTTGNFGVYPRRDHNGGRWYAAAT